MTLQQNLSIFWSAAKSVEFSLYVIVKQWVSSSKQFIFNSETLESIFIFVYVKGRVEYCICLKIMLCKADVKLL